MTIKQNRYKPVDNNSFFDNILGTALLELFHIQNDTIT